MKTKFNQILLLILFQCSLFAKIPAEQALKDLEEGNQRFVQENLLHTNRSNERRLEISSKQNPFAVIVTCSDSRVVPEVIFDQGLGDLFVIRVAGNVIGPTELESIKYAVNHLNPSIILVMGHENCGAVDAVLQGQGDEIPVIAKMIEPSAMKAKNQRSRKTLTLAIEFNAEQMRDLLLKTNSVQKNKVSVYAAYYQLQTGEVKIL